MTGSVHWQLKVSVLEEERCRCVVPGINETDLYIKQQTSGHRIDNSSIDLCDTPGFPHFGGIFSHSLLWLWDRKWREISHLEQNTDRVITPPLLYPKNKKGLHAKKKQNVYLSCCCVAEHCSKKENLSSKVSAETNTTGNVNPCVHFAFSAFSTDLYALQETIMMRGLVKEPLRA